MLRIAVLSLMLVVVAAAPTTLLKTTHPVYQRYLLITPEAQLHLQPALKLQKPFLAPITQYTTYESPKLKQEVLLYYPNAPLTPLAPLVYPSLATNLKEDDPPNPFWQGVGSWCNENFGPGAGGDNMNTGDVTAIGAAGKQVQVEKDAELIPTTKTPTAPPSGHRFFVLSGQPQFYGNFDFLNSPQNPFLTLQPLVAEESRSAASDQEAVAEDKPQPEEPKPEAAALKSEEPIILARFQPEVAVPVDETVATPAEQPLPIPSPLVQARFQSAYPAILNQPEEDSSSLEGKREKIVEPLKKADDQEEEDISIAKAQPEGIALAGRGGLASSRPEGTALVGDGGIALSSPKGISVAGDFLGTGDGKQ